jgi:hypothetical protein
MADIDKDKEQDKRLNYIDAELIDIKSVTHKSELHQWGGIVEEHRKLESTVNLLKENSDFITKFLRTTMSIFKAASIIGALFLTIFSIYHLIT